MIVGEMVIGISACDNCVLNQGCGNMEGEKKC